MSDRPTLIIGYGNPSRGDDALGHLLHEWLESAQAAGDLPADFDTLTDFQLQIEHALDLQDRALVLFIDASISAAAPYEFSRLTPLRDKSYSTHALSPAAVLSVYQQVCKPPLAPCYQLAITGYEFELGQPLTPGAKANAEAARDLLQQLLIKPIDSAWDSMTNSAS